MNDNDFATAPDFTPAFISIDAGTVTLVEKEGGRLGLWSGADYEDAMRQAEDSRRTFELDEPVHDNVAGGGR